MIWRRGLGDTSRARSRCYTERMEEKVIPILRVQDADIAVAWYKRLGFQQTSVHRFEPGFPAFVTIERGPMKLFLSEHKGDARPDTLVYLAVADVHPVAREFGVMVEEAPWGYEIELRDPDANRLRIGMPKPVSDSG
ncbi:MAG: glyoxalase superfamily protein [Candidatus Acidiferrum sp.]